MYKEFLKIAEKFYNLLNFKQKYLLTDADFKTILLPKDSPEYYEDPMLTNRHPDGKKPYKRDYLGYDALEFLIEKKAINEFETNLMNKFKAENRPLSKQKLDQFFKDFINVDNFSQNGKIDILKKIHEDCQTLDIVMEPLKKLKIDYSINIVGGAVRDFLLNRQDKIKDIDFMVSILPSEDLKDKINSKFLLFSGIFTERDLGLVNWVDDYTDIDDAKGKLIQLCCNKIRLTTHLYNTNSPTNKKDTEKNTKIPDPDEIDSYQAISRERLYSIIKLNNQTSHDKKIKFNYSFDLLMTNMTAPQFLTHFDFDICKASLCVVNTKYNKTVPKDPLHFISRFSAPTEFWADVANKQMTLNTHRKNEKMLKDSVNTHLPSLLNKYDGFKVELNEVSPNSKQITYLKDIKASMMQKMLEKNLPQKTVVQKRNKI